MPATWTPTPTGEPTATATPRPTATLPPSATPFTLVKSTAVPGVPTAVGGFAFVVQKGSPKYLDNLAHPELACNWMGVAGTVVNTKGAPMTQLIVELGGTLGGKLISPSGTMISLTGVAPQYGPSGFEFVLSDKPLASRNTLWLQLVDQTGRPLSDKVYFETFTDCNKNLVLAAFKAVR
jgi:hypothetical protein